jgi:hypothetical protein
MPRDRNLCIKGCRTKLFKNSKVQEQMIRVQKVVLTWSKEEEGRCASRETNVVCVVFFRRFIACPPTTFSWRSCSGLSTMVSSWGRFFRAVEVVKGRTTVVAFFGLLSLLKRKIIRVQEKEKINRKKIQRRYTYESCNSKISRPEPLEVVSSCGTSFRLDVPEEVRSSVHFCFFSAPWFSDSASGGDKVESLPSREPLASSPS